MMAYTCNPNYSGVKDREDCSLKSAEDKKLAKPPSQQTRQVAHTCHPKYMESVDRKIAAKPA
jgi:hypothetical protein